MATITLNVSDEVAKLYEVASELKREDAVDDFVRALRMTVPDKEGNPKLIKLEASLIKLKELNRVERPMSEEEYEELLQASKELAKRRIRDMGMDAYIKELEADGID